MHGRVIPSQKKTPTAKRAIWLLPDSQDVIQGAGQGVGAAGCADLLDHGGGVVQRVAPASEEVGEFGVAGVACAVEAGIR